MALLMHLAVWEVSLLLVLLAGVVLLQLLDGGIRTRGLLEGREKSGARYLSASRVQLLLATLAAAAQYISQVRHNPGVLPDIPRTWLLLLGGSHVLYLGNKLHGKRSGRFQI